MVERELRAFGFDGRRLTPGPSIIVEGGPAGLRARH
jgi:hypothetical protein